MKRDILLVGTGNVATHLCRALSERIYAVVSRNKDNAKVLAERIEVNNFGSLNEVPKFLTDIILISVADNAIHEVVNTIGKCDNDPLVMHTSGSVPMECLSKISHRTGVFYPLQTFSKNTPVDMSIVPFFTEAINSADLETIDNIAQSISGTVHHANAKQRRKLHLAGVFSSNFVTALLQMTQDILQNEEYPLSTVQPLVNANIEKVFAIGPKAAITGPARRGDKQIIELQKESLCEPLDEIYSGLTNYILSKYNVTLR